MTHHLDHTHLGDDGPAGGDPRAGGWLLFAGIALGLLWTAGAASYFFGFYGDRMDTLSPLQTWGMALVALAPALVLGLLGAAARELARFAATAHALQAAAARLTAPIAHAQADARALADVVSAEIRTLNQGAEGALARLAAMEEVLRHHAESVQAASGEARREIDGLIARLGNERAAIAELSDALSREAKDISANIDRQAEMVAAASDMAATHAEEGRAKLDASANGLISAGKGAQQAVERVALSIDEQIRDLEALVTALEGRAERMERVAEMQRDNVRIAKETSEQLALAADGGAGAMRTAVDEALANARRLSDVIAKETRAAAEAGASEIERVRRAAQAAREAAEAAGRALEANTQKILERVDRVNAGAFEAAERTDAAFDARVRAVERAIDAVDDRISQFPRVAEQRAREIHRVFEDGLDVLEKRSRGRQGREDDWGASDRAAQRPIDPPRPSDATRRDPGHPETGHPETGRLETGRPQIGRDSVRESAERHAARAVAPADFLRGSYGEGGGDAPPPRAGSSSPSEPSHGGGAQPLRTRRSRRRGLRLDDDGYGPGGDESRHDDEDFGRPLTGGGRPLDTSASDADDGWRWRDLLKNLDDAPQGAMIGEAVLIGLRRAGVDAARALDPEMTARISRARRRAGTGEARALVLDGAMDAVRRTAAALAADPSLRQRAEEFLDDHSRRVRRALDENDAAALTGLLDSDLGRAFLLVDAALTDA